MTVKLCVNNFVLLLNTRNVINSKLATLIPKPNPKVKGFTEKREKEIENFK